MKHNETVRAGRVTHTLAATTFLRQGQKEKKKELGFVRAFAKPIFLYF